MNPPYAGASRSAATASVTMTTKWRESVSASMTVLCGGDQLLEQPLVAHEQGSRYFERDRDVRVALRDDHRRGARREVVGVDAGGHATGPPGSGRPGGS